MNFLSCQQENPEFLNNYLKYKRFIEFGAETTVNETYFDLRTFFRYIKLKDNNEILSRDLMKKTSIVDITTKDFITINKKDIEDYIFFLKNDLENSIKTRNRKLATLKKFFQYLLNNNYITVDPTKFIKSGQTEKRLSKHLNLNESKKLLSITITKNSRNNIRNYAIICLFLNCCLRLSELVNINITDI